MIEIKRARTNEELEYGISSLTEIFIDEYPYYETWIRKHIDQFKSGEKQILSINFEVNSIHKCKIDNAGKYSVKGYADDGIIEVLEYNDDNNFNIGVQWHPGFIVDKEEENLIFKEFVSYIKNKMDDYNS